MIELGNEATVAMRVREISDLFRSLFLAISKSRFNYWASYLVDFSCPILFAWLGLIRPHSWHSGTTAWLFGLFVFTLVEYSIHRWLLHDPRSVLFEAHETHHLHPNQPSAFIFIASFAVLMPIWFLLVPGLHIPAASFFLCGFSAGYAYYGALHHFEHTTRINQIPFRWLQSRWAAHSVHHHIDRSNFGVMTSFWDYVFGTHQTQRKRKSLTS